MGAKFLVLLVFYRFKVVRGRIFGFAGWVGGWVSGWVGGWVSRWVSGVRKITLDVHSHCLFSALGLSTANFSKQKLPNLLPKQIGKKYNVWPIDK